MKENHSHLFQQRRAQTPSSLRCKRPARSRAEGTLAALRGDGARAVACATAQRLASLVDDAQRHQSMPALFGQRAARCWHG